jgi:hypothetical protein
MMDQLMSNLVVLQKFFSTSNHPIGFYTCYNLVFINDITFFLFVKLLTALYQDLQTPEKCLCISCFILKLFRFETLEVLNEQIYKIKSYEFFPLSRNINKSAYVFFSIFLHLMTGLSKETSKFL